MLESNTFCSRKRPGDDQQKLSFLKCFLGLVPGAAFQCFLVHSWPPLGGPWGSLGTPLAPLGDLGSPLGSFGPALAGPWGFPGTPLAPLGCFCLVLIVLAWFLFVFARFGFLLAGAASGCSRLASSCFWLPLTASGCSWVDRHIQRQKHTDRHRETPDSQEYRRTLQSFPVLANTGIPESSG